MNPFSTLISRAMKVHDRRDPFMLVYHDSDGTTRCLASSDVAITVLHKDMLNIVEAAQEQVNGSD